jgi:phage tail-like protein
MLLDDDGRRLVILDASGLVRRVLHLGSLLACWSALRLSSNGRSRAALWGTTAGPAQRPVLFVLDASGDAVDQIEDLEPAVPDPGAVDVAIGTDAVWIGATDGTWHLTSGESADRVSEATLLTPAMLSPESDEGSGWLRAELFVDLPGGALLEAEIASTDDARVVDRARQLAADPSMTAEARQRAIWEAIGPVQADPLRIVAPTTSELPVSIPLFSTGKRWLWLRLRLVVPAGTRQPAVRELRILYPNLSIAQHLPAIFRGPDGDPPMFLRRLTGVLETTTQSIDQRIRSIVRHLEPVTAPAEWLDFVARWLDLPWDDDLSTGSKRRLLQNAGGVLDARGTRRGLRLLLEALVGDAGRVRITDFTVDHPPLGLGGHGRRGAPLPMLLAGPSARMAVLNGKSVIGRTRLACEGEDANPLGNIVPTIGISVTATRRAIAELQPLLMRVLERYVPAGVKVSIRWSAVAPGGGDDGDLLDANGPGRVGRDASLGRTVLAGRSRGRIDDGGLGVGFRLP